MVWSVLNAFYGVLLTNESVCMLFHIRICSFFRPYECSNVVLVRLLVWISMRNEDMYVRWKCLQKLISLSFKRKYCYTEPFRKMFLPKVLDYHNSTGCSVSANITIVIYVGIMGLKMIWEEWHKHTTNWTHLFSFLFHLVLVFYFLFFRFRFCFFRFYFRFYFHFLRPTGLFLRSTILREVSAL